MCRLVVSPNPLLSTMTGTTGALVAIVGGLLVARFVGLDSEQQGVQRQVDDAEARLRIASERAEQAAGELHRYDAEDFLEDDGVLDALLSGETDLDELRRLGEPVPLTDDQLKPFVDDIRGQLRTAFDTINDTLPPGPDLPTRAWEEVKDWQDFLRRFPTIPRTDRPDIWQHALDNVVDQRIEALEQAHPPGPYDWPPVHIPAVGTPASVVARRRDDLRAAVERATQRVEDLEDEVTRLRQVRNAVVKPTAQLWVGLLVLTYPTIVGIVLPVLAMATAPSDITAYTNLLVGLFMTGLAALLGYMGYFAVRLTRRRKRLPHEPPAPPG